MGINIQRCIGARVAKHFLNIFDICTTGTQHIRRKGMTELVKMKAAQTLYLFV